MKSTAEHLQVAEGAIVALARSDHIKSKNIVDQLNTADRRDKGYFLLITELASSFSRLQESINIFRELLDAIHNFEQRDRAALVIFQGLSRLSVEEANDLVTRSKSLIDDLKEYLNLIEDPEKRAIAAGHAYLFINKLTDTETPELENALLKEINVSLAVVDRAWRRIRVGYQLSTLIASVNSVFSKELISMIESVRSQVYIDSGSAAHCYILLLKLVIRSLRGPIATGKPDIFEMLKHLIDAIPSDSTRTLLWSETALRCFGIGKVELGCKIVSDYIRPILNYFPENNKAKRYRLITEVAPSLYACHPISALEVVESLPQPQRDMALMNIAFFLLRKVPNDEPYITQSDTGYSINFETAKDIIEIIRHLETDAHISRLSEELSQSICSHEIRDKLTAQQKLDIAQRLRNFAEEKLPDLNNIRHDGYKIVVQLQAAKIDKTLSAKYNDLISSASKISNISDKSIVLAMIANALPNKMNSIRQGLLDELEVIINQIPTDIDKLDRYRWAAEILSTSEPQFAKRLLSNAMQFSMTIRTDDLL